jgi:hypothetical protein
MSACSFITAKGTPCKRKAWSGRAYCYKHEPKPAGEPESEEVESAPEPEERRPGQARGRPAGVAIDPRVLLENQRERQREQAEWLASGADDEPAVPMDQVAAQLAVLMHEHELKRIGPVRGGGGSPGGTGTATGWTTGTRRLRNAPVKLLTRRRGPDPTRIIDPITKRTPSGLADRDWVQEWVTIDRLAKAGPPSTGSRSWRGTATNSSRTADGPADRPAGWAWRCRDRRKPRRPAHPRAHAHRRACAPGTTVSRRRMTTRRRSTAAPGDEVVSIVAERDHGEKRTSVPLGKEHLYDV